MTKRRHARSWPPKGAYRLPDGSHGHDHVGKPDKHSRRIRITAKLNKDIDTKKLARAIVALAEQLIREKRERDKKK